MRIEQLKERRQRHVARIGSEIHAHKYFLQKSPKVRNQGETCVHLGEQSHNNSKIKTTASKSTGLASYSLTL